MTNMIKGWKIAYDYNENAEPLHCFRMSSTVKLYMNDTT